MSHLDAMRERLPLLYRDGELVNGLLAVPGLQLEILDEEGVAVQRAHWFDLALELEEAARLAAVLDFSPEPWQELETFRAWVHALRNALVEEGAVTPRALQRFAREYVERFQEARDLTVWDTRRQAAFSAERAADRPGFVEYPAKRVFARAPTVGGIEPLQQFNIVNRGLDEAHAALLLTGLPEGPESVPVVANLTTGEAIAYLGDVPPGARLWIRAEEDGTATARLERDDVSDRLRSVAPLTPGVAWGSAQVTQPARALRLARGRNDLWFLPVAHFDERGLDRVLLALAELALTQGRWDETGFDESLFYQEPAVTLRLTWVEITPASFDLQLPGGTLLSRAGELEQTLEDRELLGRSVDLGVRQLRAAGVDGKAVLAPFADVLGQGDAVVLVLPLVAREVGPTGADAMPDAGGVWDTTDFDDSTFR